MRDTNDVWTRITELLDVLPDDLVLCDAAGRILHVNASARSLLGQEQFPGALLPGAGDALRHGPGTVHLTHAEESVARLVIARWTNREIARDLGISVRTVQHHVLHIMTKLDVHSRRDVGPALAALRRGDVGPATAEGCQAR